MASSRVRIQRESRSNAILSLNEIRDPYSYARYRWRRSDGFAFPHRGHGRRGSLAQLHAATMQCNRRHRRIATTAESMFDVTWLPMTA